MARAVSTAPSRFNQAWAASMSTRQVRPYAGEQERKQIGRVGDVSRGLVATLAEHQRGGVVALAPGDLGQPPQRWRQPLQLGHLLTLGESLLQQSGGGVPVSAPHRQVAQDILRGDRL